ncbi:hypothetical protein [Photobacterium carnosum]|uniref:hypothetical protein n=1 Tax=Photobacterium carnosum TaxID=2023717 RepID=UPI001E2C35B3|nr:hypothetical protein [Photobacterium carnosum]MCD9529584.1 hypothetical protein [Photobacterium carnosum]MCF2153929.1 hypothetical protein [Photobacterium carnosum]MCF2215689.1 hypothetical protein [Photobacterium carnosum]
MNNSRNLLSVALFAVALSGCNGSSSDDNSTTTNDNNQKVTISSQDLIAKSNVSVGTLEVPEQLEIKKNETLTISKDATVIIK